MHVIRGPQGPRERLDDMAQAWIEGRHEEVYEWVADREARLRSVIVMIPAKRVRVRSRGRGLRAWARGQRVIDYDKVWELRELGWTLKEIANEVGCGQSQASLICRQKSASSKSACL